jgi:hypothetical protein
MDITRLWNRVLTSSRKITNVIFLHGMYFFGIGPTSLVAKLIGKHFLSLDNTNSTWQKIQNTNDVDSMF